MDPDYTGSVGVVIHNLRDFTVEIPQGTRIAQALFVRVVEPQVVTGEFMELPHRGGFGSTNA